MAQFAVSAADAPSSAQLPRPDGKPADHTKKVKVFILMGQSNMVGMGDIEPEGTNGTLTTLVKKEKKYPFLMDDAGKWTTRKDVHYYDARVKKGGPLTATSNGRSIGPELGFGRLGDLHALQQSLIRGLRFLLIGFDGLAVFLLAVE